MDAIDHLRRAKTALQGSGEPRNRLSAAAEEFWRATFYFDSWPEQLREAASAVIPLVLSGGSIKETAQRIDDGAVDEVLRRLCEFCNLGIACLTADES